MPFEKRGKIPIGGLDDQRELFIFNALYKFVLDNQGPIPSSEKKIVPFSFATLFIS